MTTRRTVLGAILAVAASPAFAQSGFAQSALTQSGDPAAPIKALDDGLIAAMKSGKSVPFPQRYATLAPIVGQAFDLPAILKVTVGLGWAGFPPAQQAQLLAVFTQFTVASYVANFDSFSGQRIEIAPAQRTIGAEKVVETSIVSSDGAKQRIDYVMRPAPNGWRATDVLLDGTISRVAVQRSDFRSLLSGSDARNLIAALHKKVSSLSGGAIKS